ncbi:Protein Hook [Araneus ventricosus]|uniref:Protein hook n=1 Tax=Araneus ventricosus TaxID=182803 RepID=A0A4Y2HKS6_ARAVE|nr:Protein Hook [Araneus ventricosus]
MDESTDINDTAQLVLFIRGVDENFEITEELACMRSLKGTTKGCDIFREFQEGLLSLKVPITNICNITTDGAPNMTGKKSAFLGLFNQNYPGNNVVFLHCVIHQDALCKSALNMKPVLDAIVKLVNTIRSRGLTHRQFWDFLQSVQSEYSDVLYYTKVRWLNAGCVFERVWQLKDDIVSFFHEKQCSAECEMLEDTEWLSDFAFFTDLLCHMNNLSVKMQGKNQFINDIWAHLKAFKLKLNLFAGQLAKNDLSHFSRLNSIPSVNKEKLKNYEEGLKKLHFEFECRFQDFSAIQTELDIFTMPFNVNCEAVRSDLQLELIELQSNNHLKQSFLNMPKLEFYESLSKVSNLKKILKGILDYYNEVLGQQITGFRMPDVAAMGEKNDIEELGRLLQLVLGCAVNCAQKHEYIEALMGLEENIQHDVMNAIQELMTTELPAPTYQSETYADLNNQVKGLTEDLHSAKESKEQITQRCHELDMQVAVLLEEKNSLLSENEKLLERLKREESFEDPSTLAGKRFQQMTQKLELMQDELFKLETGRDELKLKVENQLREILELQQKNEELQRLAEESQSMKDELDVLRHTSDKVNVYEATIESYKKKLGKFSYQVCINLKVWLKA